MKDNKSASLFPKEQVIESLKQSFVKLNPRMMIKNPIMFTVEVATVVMLLVTLYSIVNSSQGSFAYNIAVFIILFVTLLFANFAEAIAEARGKAQADSLRKTREETPAKKVEGNKIVTVSSSQLKKGDVFVCEAGDVIPSDGEIIEGLASIDESAITGESAPVIREAGGDKSSVTGGTKVLSDHIKVLVTTQPGESFLDKMIALVEGASRQKTPNEIALTILLAGFTLVFVIVCVTLKPFADYSHTVITIASLISLFVCLIPTTIGGLLSAIGIAGMDRALRANVITKSGKAVETAGDIDTLLLDKTGTITIGNRKATHFHTAPGVNLHDFVETCLLSSLSDETPEGKSIVELGRESGIRMRNLNTTGARMIKFTAETKCSGVDLADGTQIRKGAFDAIRKMVEGAGNEFPKEVEEVISSISSNGGTPLVVCVNKKVTGVIELQDIIKPGIQERFERLRKMGVKTVMVTGDNPLTAKYIAEKAGVDDFIAEAKPEDKMEYIKKEQQAGKLVAMMGDGTNDAPALAQANVGVAMNSGTQAAKEAGNMVDLDNDPTKLIEIVEIGKQLLMETVAYAETSLCRRKVLLHYFGETYEEDDCGCCDNCLYPKKEFEGEDYMVDALQLVSDVKEKFKIEHLVNILIGEADSAIKSYKHDKLELFGAGSEKSRQFWTMVYRRALVSSFIEKDIEQYGVIKLTDEGQKFLDNPKSFMLMEDHNFDENEEEEKIQEKGGVSALDSTLFAILKDLRKKIAKTNNLPPYVIFQDPSLEDMCTNYPITLEELANIQGVGAGKAQKYGKEFVEVIKQYVEDNEIERAQDMVVKTVANKSKFKVYIIQNIDRQIDLEDIASALGLNFDELIKEMEAIVFSGTKLNIDYYINKILDEEQQQEIMDYFMEASSDNISEAFDEFEGDYAEEDLRLMRLKLHSKHGN